jgi:hypothetical protein
MKTLILLKFSKEADKFGLKKFSMPQKLNTSISYALLIYFCALIIVLTVYLTMLLSMLINFCKSDYKTVVPRASAVSTRGLSVQLSHHGRASRDHVYSDGSSNLRKTSSHHNKRAGSALNADTARKHTSVDHSFILETLKKKPSKSILVTNRGSLTSNLSGVNNRVSVNSNVSSLNPGSVLGSEGNLERTGSNLDMDFNRRSGASIKSVSWNEKTQVRKMYTNSSIGKRSSITKKRSAIKFADSDDNDYDF